MCRRRLKRGTDYKAGSLRLVATSKEKRGSHAEAPFWKAAEGDKRVIGYGLVGNPKS